MYNTPIVLIIIDGFGVSSLTKGNPIVAANMPYYKQWIQQYPYVTLDASGTAVGLPEGFVGNSEVGHYAIGAGRIVPQLLTRINQTVYDDSLTTNKTHPAIHNTLKEALCEAGRTVFSIAETEKYVHITYFFNGEKEEVLSCEVRHLIPSQRKRALKEYPEMCAEEITATVLRSLEKDPKDFYLINYANADMVGHTGDFNATVCAVEIIDQQLGRLYNAVVEKMNGTLFITSDHGNAEVMLDSAGNPSPIHTTNKVPFLVVTQRPENISLAHLQGLSDIAPFILHYMGIPVPKEMEKI